MFQNLKGSMVRKRILQLIAAGIISLILSLDDFALLPTSSAWPSDCDGFFIVGGFGYNETVDPDMRYPIPVIKSIHPDPTDSVVVKTAACLQQLMQQEMWNEIEFNGQYMNEMDVEEMLNW